MTDLLTTVSILFIVLGPFLFVANRYRLPTVPALIVAGVVAGLFVDESLTLELAQYGIALLVFTFGVRVEFTGVRTVLVDSEVVALGQILVVGSLGFVFGLWLGIPQSEAIYLGVAAAFSSTIVGTALMQTEIRRELVRGRLAESIHFVQDIVAVAFILLMGAGVLGLEAIGTQLAAGVGLVAAAYLVNRYLFDVIGRLAGGSSELMIVGVVSVLVVFVGAAELAGVSVVVGAFAAGLAVRHDPVEYLGLFNGLQSVRDFFVAIFFVTIGALVAAPTIEKLVIVSGIVILTVVVKPVVTTAILLYKGYDPRTATLTSLSTDQVSEFALIIAIEALVIGLITQSVFDAIIFAAAITMITSSLTQRYDEAIYRSLADRSVFPVRTGRLEEWSNVPDDVSDHVIIAGFGRQGHQLAQTCREIDQPFVVIENDPTVRKDLTNECDAYVFGDAMERSTWERANVEDARVVVSTIDSELVSKRLLSFDFEVDLTLRASEEDTALELLEAGALYVSVSELLAGDQLVKHVRGLLEGDQTPDELRAERREALDEYVTFHPADD
ncbi:cation:proton antiporter family protein [Natrarchaeobaculum aegyptiacum]|uniref:Potassium transporter Kef n=1 Tax=Natrarchaeobaculum aegyptiacum TaxID=745377 RepID=A0A2Z2HVB6_9EURY|nr:cation:proton antiporter family protein [Natrarchaeobaculum aegyptiacum]ARS91246.1 potassium transporter Kef [Natrarchaeobaculum aegyptiacum]